MSRFLIPLLFFLLPLGAYAQGSNAFLGYSYLSADGLAGERANLNGWNGSLEGKVFPFIGIVADISGHYGHESLAPCGSPGCTLSDASIHQHTFMFGPRVSVSVGKFRPFAHYLIGAGHISVSDVASDTSLAQTVGGGIDYKLIPLVAWRFQGDLLHTSFFGTTQDNFRFSTGIVLHF